MVPYSGTIKIHSFSNNIEIKSENFYHFLCMFSPLQLKVDYREEAITEKMKNHNFVDRNYNPNRMLPTIYKSLSHYKSAYIPLIIYDCWAQIVNSYNNEENIWVEMKICKTTYENSIIEVELSCFIDFKKFLEDEIPKKGWIILLIDPMLDRNSFYPVHEKNHYLMAIATVKASFTLVDDYIRNLDYNYKLIVQLNKTERNTKMINGNNTLVMQGIKYIRPSERLIDTLSEVDQNIISLFIQPNIESFLLNYDRPSELTNFYDEAFFNEEQRKAIISCYNAVKLPSNINRVVMIQGPPGTGKTRTLIGIVKNLFINFDDHMCKRFRMLICAPSNGAIDQIALQLIKDRGFLYSFKGHDLRIVRIGNKLKTNQLVQPYHLDNLIIDETKDQLYKYYIDEVREDILRDADVILSTLGSVQMNDLKKQFFKDDIFFNCVIVDEASQCSEPEVLMPLIYNTSKIILIGDHLQLPATVMSRIAKNSCFGRSMSERLNLYFDSLSKGNPTLTLRTQYRMQPPICSFPSQTFYGGKLKTNPDSGVNQKIHLKPYLLFDLSKTYETRRGHSNTLDNQQAQNQMKTSLSNIKEVNFIFQLLLTIIQNLGLYINQNSPPKRWPNKLSASIGIVTFYKGQKEALIKKLQSFDNGKLLDYIDVNTVDAFQGQERDIMILSCVRGTNCCGNIGFVKSRQRMNVSLTRAKSVMYVCINGKSFNRTPVWNNLLQDAAKRNCFVEVKQDMRIADINRNIKF